MLNNLKLDGTVLLAATALLAAGCATTAPKAERYVTPASGSSYVVQRRDTGSYGSTNGAVPIKVSRRMYQGSEVTSWSGPTAGVLSLPSGNWLGVFAGDRPIVTWDPPIGWEWPLEVGKTWTKEYRMTNHMSRKSVTYVSSQKVEGYEDVTVPAGTFKTFRVSTRTTLGEENVVWFSPELGIWVKAQMRRSAAHPAGAGTRDDVLASHDIRR
jgi:hypothetical protein